MPEPILTLGDVVAGYQAGSVLHSVSLEAYPNSVTAIAGANGAGKTTTLRVIAGLVQPTSGRLTFEGVAAKKTRGRIRDGVALAPEGRHLFADMTVKDNLLTGAFALRDRKLTRARLDHVFEQLPFLRERQNSPARTLSGGQQQLAAIGRALMRAPRLLLLDEPTLGLSPKATEEIAAQIRALRAEGTAVVLVEQNAGVALDLADFLYVIDSGRMVDSGSASEMKVSGRVATGYFGGAEDSAQRAAFTADV